MKKFIFAMAFLISQIPNVSMAQSENYQNHVKQLMREFQGGRWDAREKAYQKLGELRELEKIDPETQKLFDLGLSIYHVSHPDILENIIEKGSLEQKKEAIEALEWQKENQNKG